MIALLTLALLGPVLGLADSGQTVHLAVGEELELLLPCEPQGAWWSVAGRCPVLARERISEDLVLGRDRWQVLRFSGRKVGQGRLRLLLAKGSGRVTREFLLEVEVRP